MANELAKCANLLCRLEGVVFFRHFLRCTDDRAAHKRVKTFSLAVIGFAGGADEAGGFPCPAEQRELPSMQRTQNTVFCS